jgi:acyl carrier protein
MAISTSAASSSAASNSAVSTGLQRIGVGGFDAADPDTWSRVRKAFAGALALSEGEVELDHTIIGDLGAESLDFLDIAFRLERAFDIKIPRGGIESTAKSDLGDEPYEIGGVLTPKALASLREAMPEVPAEEVVEGLKVTEVAGLFRVATFYNLVVHLLGQKARGELA